MKRFTKIYQSLIGKKIIAAVTGIILFGFLLGHVAGNLKVFTGLNEKGIPAIDEYGEFLREVGHPLVPDEFVLWTARIVLLAAVVLHAVVVIQLAMMNMEARPNDYVKKNYRASSLSARLMLVSGLLILAFVIFHILHFTTGTIVLGSFEYGHIYANLHSSFGYWPVALLYVAAMVGLGFHLFHGVWSLFQTLGLDNPDRNKILRAFTIFITVALVVGFSSVPLAFMSGLMKEPPAYDHSAPEGEE